MEWSYKKFSDLSQTELFEVYKLRVEVFIVEQNCPYQDIDDLDLISLHGQLWDGQKLVAYFRLIPGPDKVQIGRVIVKSSYRGKGLGSDLLDFALKLCEKEYPGLLIFAQAQAYLQDLYESKGFTPVSEIYLEDKIPHIDMIKR